MVATFPPPAVRRREGGMLMTELVVALAFLCLAVVPLAFSFSREHQLLRASYQRAVGMEIVDGEMELLIAGAWRQYSNGVYQLKTSALAATNLSNRELQLTVSGKQLRLEWRPDRAHDGGVVLREYILK